MRKIGWLMLALVACRYRFDEVGDGAVNGDGVVCGTVAVAQLAGGKAFTCARRVDGTVACWGANPFRQLGADGPTSPIPIEVALPGPAISLDVGAQHACVVLQGGDTYCWGDNARGQAGNGSIGGPIEPTRVAMPPAVEVATGSWHSCARVAADGTVHCWGANARNELGDGGTTMRGAPQPVTGVSGLTSIVAGHAFACGIAGDRTVRCWGANEHSQLGINMSTAQPTAVTPASVSDVQHLALGAKFACAIKSDKTGVCWGTNKNGQHGTADYVEHPTAVAIAQTQLEELSAGTRFTCARLSDGRAVCWGSNGNGELGDGTLKGRNAADAPVALDSAPLQIATGYAHACAITTRGVECWGGNRDGQLGDGTRAIATRPQNVATAFVPDALRSFGGYTVAWKRGGEVRVWGGAPMIAGTTTPTTPFTASGEELSSGGHFYCQLHANGTVSCIGGNYTGQLGDGTQTDRPSPVAVGGITGVVSLTSGFESSCTVANGGQIWCWGANSYNQLGDGTTMLRTAPVRAGTTNNAAEVSMNGLTSCARLTNGGVQCWGVGDHGQIGNGTTPLVQPTPAPVNATFGSATNLVVGGQHICVIAAGVPWCWGNNDGGQLGDGTQQMRSSPVQVAGLPAAATSLALGSYFTCALLVDNTVWCWGENEYGQLGDGTTTGRLAPARVLDLVDATAITAGNQHMCALTQAGAIRCWGANNGGQLGDGLPPAGATPRIAVVQCQ